MALALFLFIGYFFLPISNMPVAIPYSGALTGAGLAWGAHLSKQWELSQSLEFPLWNQGHMSGRVVYRALRVCAQIHHVCLHHSCGEEKIRHSMSYGITSAETPYILSCEIPTCLFIRSAAEVNSRIKQLFANMQFPNTHVNSLMTKLYTNGFQVRRGLRSIWGAC